jgi:putative transcriptional regulator
MAKKRSTPKKSSGAARAAAQHALASVAPKPDVIEKLRKTVQLRQEDAAWLLHRSVRAWEEWEGGRRIMPPALWECFSIKVAAIQARAAGKITDAQLVALGILLPKVEMPHYHWDYMKIDGAPSNKAHA